MYENWVLEAMKYAEERGILVITSAGNNGKDLDNKEVSYYPNDTDENGIELLSNFIRVGASSYTLDDSFFPKLE